MIKHYLYMILVPDGRAYVGVSLDPQRRFSEHGSENSPLGKAIQRYGRERCEFKVLCVGPQDFIYDLEREAIRKFNTLFPNGYNGAPSSKPYRKIKKQLILRPGDSIPVNVLRNQVDAILAPGSSPQALQNCGSVEMIANVEGRCAIGGIFPEWYFAWGQARFPWAGWLSNVLHLPSLAAKCPDFLPSELVRLNQLKPLDGPQLASLLASWVSDQGARAVWGTFGSTMQFGGPTSARPWLTAGNCHSQIGTSAPEIESAPDS